MDGKMRFFLVQFATYHKVDFEETNVATSTSYMHNVNAKIFDESRGEKKIESSLVASMTMYRQSER